MPPSSPEWDTRTGKRDKLGAALGLNTGPLGRFKASAAVLTPLVTSLIAPLLQ